MFLNHHRRLLDSCRLGTVVDASSSSRLYPGLRSSHLPSSHPHPQRPCSVCWARMAYIFFGCIQALRLCLWNSIIIQAQPNVSRQPGHFSLWHRH